MQNSKISKVCVRSKVSVECLISQERKRNCCPLDFDLRGVTMAVQQNKKSTNKRGNHRAHDFLTNPPLAVEPTTGEVHRRHHISATGFYRGKKVIATKADDQE